MLKVHFKISDRSQLLAKLDSIINAGFLVVGLFVLVALLSSHESAGITGNYPSAVAQRDIAINEANKNGQTTYSFESSGFIPGVGMITDPEAYKKQQESLVQE